MTDIAVAELRDALGDVLCAPEWHDEARCNGLDADMFFPERGEATEEAKRVCFECPVKLECLTYALDKNIKVGTWGGRSERERRRMRHERKAAARRGEEYVITPIDELPPMPLYRPKRWASARFDGEELVRRRSAKRPTAKPRRRPGPRFDGTQLVHEEAA